NDPVEQAPRPVLTRRQGARRSPRRQAPQAGRLCDEQRKGTIMLSDPDLPLLTACVDGAPSPPPRRHVQRLLDKREEAPPPLAPPRPARKPPPAPPRPPAPPALAGSVMDAAGRARPRPTPPRPPPAAIRTFPAWTGWAAAALVLVAVGLGSFLHYSRTTDG